MQIFHIILCFYHLICTYIKKLDTIVKIANTHVALYEDRRHRTILETKVTEIISSVSDKKRN